MTEQSRFAKLMTDVMENIDKYKGGMNDGAYSNIMEKLKEKYDELDKEDVLVEKSWKETNYKVKYMELAPRHREFKFNQKSYRKEFVSKIDYQYKTGIFLGKSLTKMRNCLGGDEKERIDNGEEFHEVINETIGFGRRYEGMWDTDGSFVTNCSCLIAMTVCDSECDYDNTDDCECDKCCDIEVRATPIYILGLEKV
jgi:hypothetical protein